MKQNKSLAQYILLALKKNGVCRMKHLLDEPIYMCVYVTEDSVAIIMYLNRQNKITLKKKVLEML